MGRREARRLDAVMHQHLVGVGAHRTLAICASYVNGFPGKFDILQQLGDALEAGLDHAAETSCLKLLSASPADGKSNESLCWAERAYEIWGRGLGADA